MTPVRTHKVPHSVRSRGFAQTRDAANGLAGLNAARSMKRAEAELIGQVAERQVICHDLKIRVEI
jgi:hypothetical protein